MRNPFSLPKDEIVHVELDEKKQLALLAPLRPLIGNKVFTTVIRLFQDVVVPATGPTNEVLQNSQLAGAQEWTAFLGLFEEVYIHKQKVTYFPLNEDATNPGIGLYPTTATAPANPRNVPMFWAAQQVGTDSYGSAGGTLGNFAFKAVSGAHPSSLTWSNSYRFDPKGVAVNSDGSTAWMDTNYFDATGSKYGGNVQLISSKSVGLPLQSLGLLVREFTVSFRSRT